MPVFQLDTEQMEFPPAFLAGDDGFLAKGGRVTGAWLEKAYRSGFYLWHNPMRLPDWYSPNPRMAFEIMHFDHDSTPGDEVLFFDEPSGFLKFMQKQVNREPMNNFWISGMLVKAFEELYAADKAVFMVVNNGKGNPVGYAFGAVLEGAYFGEYILSDQVFRVVCALVDVFREYEIYLADFHKPSNFFDPAWMQPVLRERYLQLLKQYTL